MSNKDGKKIRKNIKRMSVGTCRLMSFSLDKLASNLDDDQCKHLIEFHKGGKVFSIIRRKYVYLYKYIDPWEKFEGK